MEDLRETTVEQKVQAHVLNAVLGMAIESLCPKTFDKFADAYNEINEIRELGLEKL